MHMDEIEAEQRKYNSFWDGIQRRIAMRKIVPRLGNRSMSTQAELEFRKKKVYINYVLTLFELL